MLTDQGNEAAAQGEAEYKTLVASFKGKLHLSPGRPAKAQGNIALSELCEAQQEEGQLAGAWEAEAAGGADTKYWSRDAYQKRQGEGRGERQAACAGTQLVAFRAGVHLLPERLEEVM